MSLTAARTRPRGSRANATACPDVRKTSARTQIVATDRSFDTGCDSRAGLISSVGYGSYCQFVSVVPREIAGESEKAKLQTVDINDDAREQVA